MNEKTGNNAPATDAPAILLGRQDGLFKADRHPWADGPSDFPGELLTLFQGRGQFWGVAWPTRQDLVDLIAPWPAGALRLSGVGICGVGSHLELVADPTTPPSKVYKRGPYLATCKPRQPPVVDAAPGSPPPQTQPSFSWNAVPPRHLDDPPLVLVGAVGEPYVPGVPPWRRRVRPTEGQPTILPGGFHAWAADLSMLRPSLSLASHWFPTYVDTLEVHEITYMVILGDLRVSHHDFRGDKELPSRVALNRSWLIKKSP